MGRVDWPLVDRDTAQWLSSVKKEMDVKLRVLMASHDDEYKGCSQVVDLRVIGK
jgi:hypothetical protein